MVTETTGPCFRFESLAAVGRNQQRQMRELRRFHARRAEDQDVFERVGEMILPAHDVADPQIHIVRAGSQMIGGRAVTAQQREVFDIVGRFRLFAENGVGESDYFTVARNPEAQHEGLAGGGTAVGLLTQHVARRIAFDGAKGLVRFLRRRGEIPIREAFRENRLRQLLMQRQSLGLPVLLIPSEAQPVQPREDGLQRFFCVSLQIRVVNAQDHSAAIPPRVKPVENEGARTPDVQIARWGGRKPNSEHEIAV